MSIRSTIGNQETISGFEAAAKRHWEAGFELLTKPSPSGVLLMGYAAELMLKAAYFRYKGYATTADIGLSEQNRTAHQEARSLGIVPMSQTQKGHDLRYWSELIIAVRERDRKILDPVFLTDWRSRVRRLMDNWDVNMRYQDLSGVLYTDLSDVFDDVSWIFDNYDIIWR